MDPVRNSNDHAAILTLRELADRITCVIIISTIDSAKTVSQICHENKVPLSSIYKKIQRLHKAGAISIEKINIDNKGKKIAFYRSRITSVEFNLNTGRVLLQFNKNDITRSTNTTAPEYSIQKGL